MTHKERPFRNRPFRTPAAVANGRTLASLCMIIYWISHITCILRRPMAAEPQQARQLSALARAASSLQLQLSAVQDRLSAFATALTSSGTTPFTAVRHQNLRSKGPAASPPAAASPAPTAPEQTTAEGFAAAKAAIASKLRDHTYNPAALKVRALPFAV